MKATKKQMNQLVEKAKFYMDEMHYLSSSIEVEKNQGRIFNAKLSTLVEHIELYSNANQSFIQTCFDALRVSSKKFA